MSILVIGAGPAGIAAAVSAAAQGAKVTVIDDNPAPGGQIWRGEYSGTPGNQAAQWFQRFRNAKVHLLSDARVVAVQPDAKTVTIEQGNTARTHSYSKVILATGARELFLPFPGWTLPGVFGVGGLQALVKCGLPIRGKRVAVTGSGPLLLAVAAYLRKKGAKIVLIAEQAKISALARFATKLLNHPGKFVQAVSLQTQLMGIPYHRDTYLERVEGDSHLQTIYLRKGARRLSEAVDFAAVAYGFAPETELAAAFRCDLGATGVIVDELQMTQVDGVYCAGESTGIGGVDVSLVEGEIAGLAAAGNSPAARALFARREKERRFADALNRTFAPREELQYLCEPDTTVCRCEDVTYSQLLTQPDSRSAKLHTRCGMGPCQGRICGPATQYLFGWDAGSVRPPVLPARTATLALISKQDSTS